MSTQQRTQEAPYLTHVVSHHGQLTLIPPENAGRMRKPKSKKRIRPERPQRAEEEMRFNTGPPRSPSALSGRGRRRTRSARRDEHPDISIPDYPPPSFQEAISTPSSMTPPASILHPPEPGINPGLRTAQSYTTLSTLRIPLPSASPDPSPYPSEPSSTVPVASSSLPQSPAPSPPTSPTRPNSGSDSSSLEIVDLELVKTEWEEDRRLGLSLEERVKREFHRKQAADEARLSSATAESTERREISHALSDIHASRQGQRGILSESDNEAPTPTSPTPTARRRRTLSPLKVLTRQPCDMSAPMSALPSSSTYSLPLSRSSPFLRSTNSLARPPVSNGVPSTKSEHFVSRKLFSVKGKEKERDNEPLESWEVVEPSSSRPPSVAIPRRPGSPTPTPYMATPSTPPQPPPWSGGTSGLTSMRDRKAPPPPPAFINRPLRRPPPPPPPLNSSSLALHGRSKLTPVDHISSDSGTSINREKRAPPPLLLSKKSKPPPPPPPPPPSLLGHTNATALHLNNVRQNNLRQPHEIPLPPTPSDMLTFAEFPRLPEPASHLPRTTANTDLIPPQSALDPGSLAFPVAPPVSAPSSPTRPAHHYPWRPLPRPPAGPRAPPSTVPTTPTSYTNQKVLFPCPQLQEPRTECPVGDLIDLGDPTSDGRNDESAYGWSFDATQGHDVSVGRVEINNIPASLPVLPANRPEATTASPAESQDILSTSSSASSVSVPPDNTARPPIASPPFSEYTDLDVLLSRMDEHNARDGADYEDLLLVSEFVGPAQRPRDEDNKSASLLGKIEIERRRVTKDGRVKLKLSLLGVGVDKCGICLSQFKEGEWAGLGASCQHAFHEHCLRTWLARSRTCPMCRTPLETTA